MTTSVNYNVILFFLISKGFRFKDHKDERSTHSTEREDETFQREEEERSTCLPGKENEAWKNNILLRFENGIHRTISTDGSCQRLLEQGGIVAWDVMNSISLWNIVHCNKHIVDGL